MDSKLETKNSQSDKVDGFIKKFSHPLMDVIVELRKIILETDKNIGEEIKWNAPSFFYSGELEASDPKEYKRYIIVFNVHPMEHIMLVFPHGEAVDDGSGFLTGDFKDGRRLATFDNLAEVKKNKTKLQKVIKELLKTFPS